MARVLYFGLTDGSRTRTADSVAGYLATWPTLTIMAAPTRRAFSFEVLRLALSFPFRFSTTENSVQRKPFPLPFLFHANFLILSDENRRALEVLNPSWAQQK